MAAIRQMLADLKEGADAAPELQPEEPPEPVAPAPSVRRRSEDEEEERDALKSRIDTIDKLGKAAKGEAKASGYDPAKLRRLHERRAKKLQKSRDRKKKSGAFLTGITLVGTVTATNGFRPYAFAVAPDHAAELATSRTVVDVTISTEPWSPTELQGGADERELGVMVDRLRVD